MKHKMKRNLSTFLTVVLCFGLLSTTVLAQTDGWTETSQETILEEITEEVGEEVVDTAEEATDEAAYECTDAEISFGEGAQTEEDEMNAALSDGAEDLDNEIDAQDEADEAYREESDGDAGIKTCSVDEGPMTIADADGNAEAATVEEMQAALADEEVCAITLTEDLEISVSANNRFDVERDVTIDLNQKTITVSSGNNYLFYVTAENFTVMNGTIEGSSTTSYAVYAKGAENALLNIVLDSVTIQNYGANTYGTVYTTLCNLTLTDCVVQDNTCRGVLFVGSGSSGQAGEMKMENCTISNCKHTTTNVLRGGGFAVQYAKKAAILNNTITDNSVGYNGNVI